ncbi:hypothetical protein [Streptomyces misionensis]|uniref:hypothetical protein n=1 Tax=Streptomyces misionensis TaxID=67331 RepID=UPI00396B916B
MQKLTDIEGRLGSAQQKVDLLNDPTVGLTALHGELSQSHLKILEKIEGGVTGLREENREIRRRQNRKISDRALTPYRSPEKPAWPKAGSRSVGLTAKPVRAGTLPVWVSTADKPSSAKTAPVRVQLASRSQALRAGADAGLLVGLGHTRSKGKVRVVLDYSSIAQAFGYGYGYGYGYGSRLILTRLPACALTTPQRPECRTRTPLEFTNRATADQLTAAATTTDSAIGVTSGSRGSQGDVALSYDSQSVDGETSARNSKASWIGDGWGYQPGFVERTYRPCGSLLDSDGNKILKGSGDECWGGDNATVSFGSHSGRLVPATSSGAPGEIREFRLEGDDGAVVQELSGAANGLHDGVYFRVLTTDGTAAYFGADHAPTGPGTDGTVSTSPGDDSTGAAWGVPVLHPRSGDPCHNDTDGKKSRCDKPEGWRWNLDFVVSPTGFVQRYDYSTETGSVSVDATVGGKTVETVTDADQRSTLSAASVMTVTRAVRTEVGRGGARARRSGGRRCSRRGR